MPTIGQMVANSATTEVSFNGLVVKVDYFPGKVTERTIQEIRVLSQSTADDIESRFSQLNMLLCGLIKSWDLTEDDGETMFPLDPERMADLPIKFRSKLAVAILQDIRPEE